MKKKLVFIVLVCLLSSCFSIKPGVTKTGAKCWEEFYVSPGVNQYFIKPLLFKSAHGEFVVDFTFRNSADSVTINFNLIDTNPISPKDSICLINSRDTVQIKSRQPLFNSQSDKTHKIRETGKLAFSDFDQLISSPEGFAVRRNTSISYSPTRKTLNSLQQIKTKLLDVELIK